MKVKRYTGNSLEKIREVIIKELGEKAVIINVQKTNKKSNLLALGKKQAPSFEVVAAVEDAMDVNSFNPDAVSSSNSSFEEFLEIQREQYRGLRQSIKMLDEKLADVDERIETMSLDNIAKEDEDALKNIHPNWRSKVLQLALQEGQHDHPTTTDLHEALASLVPTAGGIMFRRTPSSEPDIYVFVGPTGVGKTTTLAKLAAKCVLAENLNVGLITLDTFRVAAVDQLREYASLLGVEVAVAFSNKELEQQLKNFYDKDIVLIDTPGRSQFDTAGINNISETLGNLPGLTTLLAVPANVRKEDAAAIYESYSTMSPCALIITKTDEASCCDGLTTLLDTSGVPVVYLTDGQRVPEDIHSASPGIIASMVMPEIKSLEPIKIGDFNNAVQQ